MIGFNQPGNLPFILLSPRAPTTDDMGPAHCECWWIHAKRLMDVTPEVLDIYFGDPKLMGSALQWQKVDGVTISYWTDVATNEYTIRLEYDAFKLVYDRPTYIISKPGYAFRESLAPDMRPLSTKVARWEPLASQGHSPRDVGAQEMETVEPIEPPTHECCYHPKPDHMPWCVTGIMEDPKVQQAVGEHVHELMKEAGFACWPMKGEEGHDETTAEGWTYEWMDPDCKVTEAVYAKKGEWPFVGPKTQEAYIAYVEEEFGAVMKLQNCADCGRPMEPDEIGPCCADCEPF